MCIIDTCEITVQLNSNLEIQFLTKLSGSKYLSLLIDSEQSSSIQYIEFNVEIPCSLISSGNLMQVICVSDYCICIK